MFVDGIINSPRGQGKEAHNALKMVCILSFGSFLRRLFEGEQSGMIDLDLVKADWW